MIKAKDIMRPDPPTVSPETTVESLGRLFIESNLSGMPVVDADGMGRAYPELQMATFTMHAIPAAPMWIGDEKGNHALLTTIDNHWTERLARSLTIQMGARALIALFPMTARQLSHAGIHGTVTLAEKIGKALRTAHAGHADPVAAVQQAAAATRLFTGKVADVERRTEGGFARGSVTLDGLASNRGSRLKVHFQNEFLIAYKDDTPLITTPDLITMLDSETGSPVTTEALRYGLRLQVLAMPCHPQWRTPAGLALVGPAYFGYKTPYRPIGA